MQARGEKNECEKKQTQTRSGVLYSLHEETTIGLSNGMNFYIQKYTRQILKIFSWKEG